MNTVFKLPIPSTSFERGVKFSILPRRVCELSAQYENDDCEIIDLKMLFEGLQSFRCMYLYARSPLLINFAYDQVIEVSGDSWFEEIKSNLLAVGQSVDRLKHYAVSFDDGPGYEFICEGFRVE